MKDSSKEEGINTLKLPLIETPSSFNKKFGASTRTRWILLESFPPTMLLYFGFQHSFANNPETRHALDDWLVNVCVLMFLVCVNLFRATVTQGSLVPCMVAWSAALLVGACLASNQAVSGFLVLVYFNFWMALWVSITTVYDLCRTDGTVEEDDDNMCTTSSHTIFDEPALV